MVGHHVGGASRVLAGEDSGGLAGGEPGEGATDQGGDARGRGGERAEGLVGDGPPSDPSRQVGTDQVDPLTSGAPGLAAWSDTEDFRRAVAGTPLGAEVPGTV